eukprot:1303297-Rhodomonas_salina.2
MGSMGSVNHPGWSVVRGHILHCEINHRLRTRIPSAHCTELVCARYLGRQALVAAGVVTGCVSIACRSRARCGAPHLFTLHTVPALIPSLQPLRELLRKPALHSRGKRAARFSGRQQRLE